jgi:D-xylose reductase
MLREVLNTASIRPAVHQFEAHPYLIQERQVRFCQSEGIAVTAFSPLGAPSYLPLGMARPEESVLVDPVVAGIAAALGRTPAQVVLRWGVQRGCAQVFDFSLSDGQMQAIDALDRHRRFNDPGYFCEKAFNTFFPIFD